MHENQDIELVTNCEILDWPSCNNFRSLPGWKNCSSLTETPVSTLKTSKCMSPTPCPPIVYTWALVLFVASYWSNSYVTHDLKAEFSSSRFFLPMIISPLSQLSSHRPLIRVRIQPKNFICSVTAKFIPHLATNGEKCWTTSGLYGQTQSYKKLGLLNERRLSRGL